MAQAKRKAASQPQKPLSPRKLRKRAKDALSIGKWIARKRKKRLDPGTLEELQGANVALAGALKSRDLGAIREHGERLAELLEGKLKPLKPKEWWLYLKGMLIFGGIAAILRIVVFELFSIPSGSMLPTLQVGDRVVVNKASFGLRVPFTYHPPRKGWRGRDPRHGEVIVFLHPDVPEREMVKRAIAVAGDEIRFREGRVWLRRRGEKDFVPIPRTPKGQHAYCNYELDAWSREEVPSFEERHGDATYTTLGMSEAPPDGFRQALLHTRRHASAPVQATADTFGPIPDDNVFMLGDNRQQSEDSRFWGTVPYDYLEGPVLFDLFSYGGKLEKNCDTGVRWNRFFRPID